MQSYKGKTVLIMGLGLNGGGVASARFFAREGASVLVTDLRSPEVLAPSIKALSGFPNIEYRLGEHKIEDFEQAALVIKSPGVPASSPYLKAAKKIETDISIFLDQAFENTIIAVTGTKGKSTIVSSLKLFLDGAFENVILAGNITKSPLDFLPITKDQLIILELSSWQLADIKAMHKLRPRIAIISNVLRDHQNKYDNFEQYVADKCSIYQDQTEKDFTLFSDDEQGRSFGKRAKSQSYFISAGGSSPEGAFLGKELTGHLSLPGFHDLVLPTPSSEITTQVTQKNMLFAATAAVLVGEAPQTVFERARLWKGIAHRMEVTAVSSSQTTFINDTTATIPDATIAALKALSKPVHLLLGGQDKNLDYRELVKMLPNVASIHLLRGSATTEKILPLLKKEHIPFSGPLESFEQSFKAAAAQAKGNDYVLLSPGATSFSEFNNEFERGDLFRRLSAEAAKKK